MFNKEFTCQPQSQQYDYTYSYALGVQNWFCIESFKSNPSRFVTGDLLDSKFSSDAWIYSEKNIANIRFSLTTELTNHHRPILTFNVASYFEPAGYKEDFVNLPQFVEPYQDIVEMSIAPDENSPITLSGEYKADLQKSANENMERKIATSCKSITGRLGIDHPVKIELGSKSKTTNTAASFTDFELLSRARNTSIFYTAHQTCCYYEGMPIHYNVAAPDWSMHSYGHFPDYFNSPSCLARGGLAINSTQAYGLKESKGELNCDLTISFRQRMVSMSMWRWCANYGFFHDAKARVSLSIKKGLISELGLFNKNVQTQLTRKHVVMGNESIHETINNTYSYNKHTPS